MIGRGAQATSAVEGQQSVAVTTDECALLLQAAWDNFGENDIFHGTAPPAAAFTAAPPNAADTPTLVDPSFSMAPILIERNTLLDPPHLPEDVQLTSYALLAYARRMLHALRVQLFEFCCNLAVQSFAPFRYSIASVMTCCARSKGYLPGHKKLTLPGYDSGFLKCACALLENVGTQNLFLTPVVVVY